MSHIDPEILKFPLGDLPLKWQMTWCERYALHTLLASQTPRGAIEIGTYRGGSLQVIAEHSDHVYAIDIDDYCKRHEGDRFENVEFLIGDSKEMISSALESLDARGIPLEFVLIDGDHTGNGVRRDIELILKYVPKTPLTVVMHDSFNPGVRAGIKAADWGACPHVYFVELDFIPGVFHSEARDSAGSRSMWGGLAVAKLYAEARDFELRISEAQRMLFDTMYWGSSHCARQPLYRKIRRRLFP